MTNSQAASVESVTRLVKDFSLGTSSIQEIRAEVTRLAEQGAAPTMVVETRGYTDGAATGAPPLPNNSPSQQSGETGPCDKCQGSGRLLDRRIGAVVCDECEGHGWFNVGIAGPATDAPHEGVCAINRGGKCTCSVLDAAPQAVQAEPVEVRFKYEGLTPVEGYDAIYAEYSTTFGRYPDAFMAKVVSQVKQDLFMWWGAHREKIRAGLVLLEAQDADRAARVSPAQDKSGDELTQGIVHDTKKGDNHGRS